MKFDVPSEVIDKLFACGYEEQIVDIVMSCENTPNTEVSDIPVSPTLMETSGEKIIISSEVYQVYLLLVERIGKPETAQEIPFFLLGNRKKINGETYVVFEQIKYDMEKALSETHVYNDEELFKQFITDDHFSIISIGHTHGNVKEEMKETLLARTLPEYIRKKYEIRDAGLNISLADIWQHEAFKQIADRLSLATTKEIFQTIIMYNGDMVMISPNGIRKINEIQTILSDGRSVFVPSAGTNHENLHR